jgi:hypothetical protein
MITIALLAEYATIASGIALTLSVLFVGYELRVNARLTRASNAQALVEMSASFIVQIVQDRDTARFWNGGHPALDHLDELDHFRYLTLMNWWLIFHENIHFQYHKGLLDKDIYLAWDYELRAFVRKHGVENYWPEIRDGFRGGFAQYLDRVVVEREARGG